MQKKYCLKGTCFIEKDVDLIRKSRIKGFEKERRVKRYESCFEKGRVGLKKEEFDREEFI